MPEMIQINFNRWFPVFPIAGVCLLPHTSFPLRIFEPRYIQMIDHLLKGMNEEEEDDDLFSSMASLLEEDEELTATPVAADDEESWHGSRQFALALFRGDRWKQEYHGNPPIRPVVCIGQIERCERLLGGRYDILLQGICRGRVVEERMPGDDRMYRLVRLRPLEANPEMSEPALVGWRSRVRELLEHEPFEKLRYQENVLQLFDRDDIPSHVLVEFAGHLLMTSVEDMESRYRLLAEPDPVERAEFVESQLIKLERSIESVTPQVQDWPKGLSWN